MYVSCDDRLSHSMSVGTIGCRNNRVSEPWVLVAYGQLIKLALGIIGCRTIGCWNTEHTPFHTSDCLCIIIIITMAEMAVVYMSGNLKWGRRIWCVI